MAPKMLMDIKNEIEEKINLLLLVLKLKNYDMDLYLH
jgi:hypothetical protein